MNKLINWFEDQNDSVKGLIVMALFFALAYVAHGAEAKGHKFVGSGARVKVSHGAVKTKVRLARVRR